MDVPLGRMTNSWNASGFDNCDCQVGIKEAARTTSQSWALQWVSSICVSRVRQVL